MPQSNEMTTREAKAKLVMVALRQAEHIMNSPANVAATPTEKAITDKRQREGCSHWIDMVRPLVDALFLQRDELYDVINNIDAGMAIGKAIYYVADNKDKADGKGSFTAPKLFGAYDCQLDFAWSLVDGKNKLTLKVVANDEASADYASMVTELLESLKNVNFI